ncbi:LytR family transcriptional regulator [Streptomyces albus subsp. chlorinus]|nr:LytR family transcriptional regulator [Streptomyces albus subsp. chlorinus]
MLTPPGLGGKYRIKGDRYPRMRRPRRRGRRIAAATAAVLAVSVLGWGTLQLVDAFSADEPDDAAATVRTAHGDCATPAASAGTARDGDAAHGRLRARSGTARTRPSSRLPAPGSLTVNVLNATSRSGLAQDTADALEKRGFKVGEVDNAPASLDGKVRGAGVLLGAPGAESTARLKVLATQLKGADIRRDKGRHSAEVDLVLGKGFTKLTGAKKARAALAALAKRARSHPAPTGTLATTGC